MGLSLSEGVAAVALAREAVEARVKRTNLESGGPAEGPFNEQRGVFVTLNAANQVDERLRGCIGFPFPVKALGEAIQEAAAAAASEDPRFPPVTEGELSSLLVEVSVLTPPQDLVTTRRQDLPSMIRIGEDGLIISNSAQSGLLLPQVATEFHMDSMEFLSQACMKAGLLPDSWLDAKTRVQVFQAEVFGETRPGGEVIRVEPQES